MQNKSVNIKISVTLVSLRVFLANIWANTLLNHCMRLKIELLLAKCMEVSLSDPCGQLSPPIPRIALARRVPSLDGDLYKSKSVYCLTIGCSDVSARRHVTHAVSNRKSRNEESFRPSCSSLLVIHQCVLHIKESVRF